MKHRTRLLALCASTLGSCEGNQATVVCGMGDIDCFASHLVIREKDGSKASLVEIDTALLTPDPGPEPTPGPPYVWAVGTEILGFDGTTWFVDGDLPDDAKMYGVWGASAGDVWAVGAKGGSGSIYHRDATGWSEVTLGGAIPFLASVWGSASNDVWAVGDAGVTVHWEGSAWTVGSSGSPYDHTSVFGTAAGDVWTTSGNEIRHWNGSLWSLSLNDLPRTMSDVWAFGAADAWVVGGLTYLHWDGSDWSGQAPLYPSPLPDGVWGSAPGDVWVSQWGGVMNRWNGSGFTANTDLEGTGNLGQIFGTGPNDVWVAGPNDSVGSEFHAVSHWNGQVWQPMATPNIEVGDIWAAAPTVDVGGPPTITNQPPPMVFDWVEDVLPVDEEWTDPNACRPAFCFTVCASNRLRCVARTFCTPAQQDGLLVGRTSFLVSIAAEPELDADEFLLQIVPLSSPDWQKDPLEELGPDGIADVGSPVTIPVSVIAAPEPGGGGGGWDGGYTCVVDTVTPAGPTSGTGTFACSSGSCADPGGTFTGTVDANGRFVGNSTVCQGCNPLAITGMFHASERFVLMGSSGSVSQTMDCRKD
jgi:hypothetical protein